LRRVWRVWRWCRKALGSYISVIVAAENWVGATTVVEVADLLVDEAKLSEITRPRRQPLSPRSRSPDT
jgi:hypothetical protein